MVSKRFKEFFMKKVIKGHLFNTDTARLVCSKRTDSYIFNIYCSKSGQYFKFYSSALSGESLAPLTHDEAREVVRREFSSDVFEKEFAAEAAVTRFSISLDSISASLLKEAQIKSGLSASAIIRELIKEHLKGA